MHLDDALQMTDDLLVSVVASDVEVLEQASRHIIAAGGKRVRPRILFLSYQSVGGTDLASAVPLAAAIELVHTATLVHDDINDHGVMRRGRVTVNERWGRTFALLTGDFLFTKVYSMMAPYKDLNTILAEATVALVEGETLQAAAARDKTLNRETYQQIVAKKTASLFRAAAQLGATHGGGRPKAIDALGEYGFYVGLAFQVVDDLLDLIGDPSLMGKDARVDLSQGKGVGMAYAAEHSPHNGKAVTELVLDEQTDTVAEADPFIDIKRRLIANGASEEGRMMARMIAQQAENALSSLPENESIAELRGLIEHVINRNN